MDKFKKAVEIMRGMIAVVKGGYILLLGRDGIVVVDPRAGGGTDDMPVYMIAGMRVYQETRADRSWADMLLSVLENMGPVLEDDKRDGKTTAKSRAEDDELPPCDNPNCPIHGDGDGDGDPLHRPANGPLGWHMPEIPEA
jgi:hypothetical protein